MVKRIVAQGAFYWLRVPRDNADLRHEEFLLAVVRLLLSVACLGAITLPGSVGAVGPYVILSLSYIVFSVLVLLALHFRAPQSPFSYIAIRCADILWITQIIALIHWPIMGLVLFLFILLCAAFRWGFCETLLTCAIFCILLPAGWRFHNLDPLQLWHSANIFRLIPEAMLGFVIVCLVGLLGEAKASCSESNAMVRTIAGIHIETGLENALRNLGVEGCSIFGATQILFAVHEKNRRQSTLYRVVGGARAGIQSIELDPLQQAHYFFPEPATSMRLETSGQSEPPRFKCFMLKSGKIMRMDSNYDLPKHFLTAYPFHLLLATALAFDDLTIRIYVIDPKPYFAGGAGLRYLDYSVRQIAPIVHGLFQINRLTTRAKAAANGQVARELHDGVIQSLAGINLQLEELRRQASPIFAPGVDPIAGIQKSVQEEIISLRDLTQHLRAMEIDSKRLLDFLAGMAVKFECEHGIATRFVSEVDEVMLSPRICMELVRITQEALANVRKHSDSKEALIRLARRNGSGILSIIDNGRGFRFSGHRSHEELLASGEGPRILMERANSIGGKVSIESIEGSGSCLEIVFPLG